MRGVVVARGVAVRIVAVRLGAVVRVGLVAVIPARTPHPRPHRRRGVGVVVARRDAVGPGGRVVEWGGLSLGRGGPGQENYRRYAEYHGTHGIRSLGRPFSLVPS